VLLGGLVLGGFLWKRVWVHKAEAHKPTPEKKGPAKPLGPPPPSLQKKKKKNTKKEGGGGVCGVCWFGEWGGGKKKNHKVPREPMGDGGGPAGKKRKTHQKQEKGQRGHTVGPGVSGDGACARRLV